MRLTPPLNVTRVTKFAGRDKLQSFFRRNLAEGGVHGWDIETTPLRDYFYRRCRTIQFGNQAEQYVIDLLDFCDGDPDLLYRAQGNYGANLHLAQNLREVLHQITPVVCGRDFLKVGVSLGFEYMSFYWLFGLRTQNFYDCAQVERCIWAGAHSLKDYGFYSMEEMMSRYFHVQIEKKYQESFTLDANLSDEQIGYAALDTRFPLALRSLQMLILNGETFASLEKRQHPAVAQFRNVDKILTGNNLVEIARIENDAIGAFQDMHVHGENMDRERWLARVGRDKAELVNLYHNVLDPIFIPYVGNKNELVTDEQVDAAEAKWKAYNAVSDAEIAVKAELRHAKKHEPETVAALEARLLQLQEERKREKEVQKKVCGDLKKKRTRLKNLAAESEGDALINYGSDAQILHVLHEMPEFKKVTSLDDEILEQHIDVPVFAAIRKLHGLLKSVGTYGDQWAMEWKTKPCKEEGWLHPGDGRLHCTYNQYDAETGRSSSEKPNGQNLPQDKEVRSCFIADPPDEAIRISRCCGEECYEATVDAMYAGMWKCPKCLTPYTFDETDPETYVIVTADMSGAELRIIAELAQDPVWIGAFRRKEDVHSVGAELLYPERWPELAVPDCAYYKLNEEGQPQRKKCKCPGHMELRDGNKSTNFLLAYGGGPDALAAAIGQTREKAQELMAIHEQKNPLIWAYLEKSGRDAQIRKRSFDMFGRRRIFPEPTRERAKEKAKKRLEKKLRLPPEEAEANRARFIAEFGRKPTPDERWVLSHKQPTEKQITSSLMGMHSGIARQGKNHAIQGTNATIAKLAMGSGYSPDGQPYLWHTLPKYKTKLLKFVHDELVVQCPVRYSELVAGLIGDAFKRAAAEKMKQVVMEFEYNIAPYWKK